MQNQIELILRSGSSVTTEYTFTFNDCPQTTEIECSIVTIYLGYGGTLSPTPMNAQDVWVQLANENGTITLYDAYDVETGTLTINSYVPTSQKLFFVSDANCASIVADACYFKFSLTVSDLEEHYLDLYPNESISLSYQFTDLNNFSQIGTFSRDFRIPASKKNVEALGPLYDYNFVDDVQSFSRKYTCELRVDTIPISRGYLRVMAAYKQADFLSDFQVAFYSEAPNFVKAIGEKKLKDLTDLPNLDEAVNFTNVTTITNQRIWGLIDRAQNNRAFSESGEANTTPTQDPTQNLEPNYLTPCLRGDYILEQIFSDAGFELDGTTLQTILSDYYVPWINSQQLQGNVTQPDVVSNASMQSSADDFLMPQSFTTIVLPTSLQTFGLPAYFDATTYRYNVLYSGQYTISTNLNFTRVAPIIATEYSANVQFIVEDYDASNTLYSTVIIGNATLDWINGFTPNPTTGTLTAYTAINTFAGHTLQIKVKFTHTLGLDRLTITFDGGSYTINAVNINTTDIIYADNAPDIKQIDFVSDIIKMHNLAVIPDVAIENKLLLEPMSTYLGSGSTLDWTKKLDTSKDIVIKGTDDIKKSKLYFSYSAGQDTYSKLFVDQGRIYGDYKVEPYTVDANQVPSEFLTGSTEVKLIAQSTPSTQVNGSSLICPRFWTQSGNEPPKFTAPGLRFLYWSESSGVYLFDDVTNFEPVYQNVPLLNHYNDTSGDNPNFAGQYDLNWAPETPLHDYTMNPQNNLFTQYWRDYLDSIYSNDARTLEASFALNNTDILSLNFGDYIFVKDAYWRIIELSDYKMGQYESTRVKLLKASPGAPAKPACNIIPVSNNQDGSVNFETPAGASVSATQYCCNYFNFTWSVNTNLCYGKVRDRPGITNPNNDSTGKGEITSLNSISVGANNVITTVGLDAGSSTFSVFAGNDIKVTGSNDNLIAVGDTLEVKGDQRGIAMFGKSVESAVPGLVVGGGWPQDDRTYAYNGSQSAGTFLMSEQGTYSATLDKVELFIEGIANKRIEMADEMLWYIRMHLMVQPTINQYINATITAQMGKTGGIAFATTPIVQYQDTSMAGRTVNLVIDTTTNTAQHRMNIELAGGSYPFITRLLAEINYTQFR